MEQLDPATQIHRSAARENVSLWPLLLWPLLGMLLIEWFVYLRKVRI